jgi:hypothetical protein
MDLCFKGDAEIQLNEATEPLYNKCEQRPRAWLGHTGLLPDLLTRLV